MWWLTRSARDGASRDGRILELRNNYSGEVNQSMIGVAHTYRACAPSEQQPCRRPSRDADNTAAFR
jgi:hypothetical protein